MLNIYIIYYQYAAPINMLKAIFFHSLPDHIFPLFPLLPRHFEAEPLRCQSIFYQKFRCIFRLESETPDTGDRLWFEPQDRTAKISLSFNRKHYYIFLSLSSADYWSTLSLKGRHSLALTLVLAYFLKKEELGSTQQS